MRPSLGSTSTSPASPAIRAPAIPSWSNSSHWAASRSNPAGARRLHRRLHRRLLAPTERLSRRSRTGEHVDLRPARRSARGRRCRSARARSHRSLLAQPLRLAADLARARCRLPPRRRRARLSPNPQLTAFFTSAAIFASSAAVNSFSANATGHMAPLSRFAASLKPNIAYLSLNLWAPRKKQTTLPSLAYAGIPYQVLGERAGALALTIAWSRLAIARSGSGISAIFASTALSPSALSARGPRRASAFSSWARSFIADRSSSVNPLDFLPLAVVVLADFCVAFFALIVPSLQARSCPT